MKLICSKANLLHGVNIVSKAVPTRTTMAILECILIDASANTLRNLRKQLYTEPGAYVLIHSASRKNVIGDRLDEVYKLLVKETKGVPFIMPFTFGEYGYDSHSANITGGLMLSFTVFGKN